jgi:TolA-binding protein
MVATVVEHSMIPFRALYQTFMSKLGRMRTLDEDNEFLRRRLAELEIENARLTSGSLAVCEKERAEEIKAEAKHEGGVETARTIASLNPKDEKMLSQAPEAIFKDAMKAFGKGDYETTAKALTHLAYSEDKESKEYQTAQAFYIGGVSLYKMGNYKKAHHFLERALASATKEDVAYAPRAMAWIALCQARLGDKAGERRTIFDLIQKYPKSKEARGLNRRGGA